MRIRQLISLLLIGLFLAACAPASPAVQAPATEAPQVEEQPMDEPPMEADQAMVEATPAGEMMGDSNHDDMSMDDAVTESMGDMPQDDSGSVAAEDDDMMAAPAWFSVSLSEVTSGETFTIQDLQGKVVLVETMAQWCTNCLAQQKQVLALHEALGERDDFVSLGLDIDPNEEAAMLKEYTARNGFFWKYAISPAEVSRDISQLYGDQFLNPPSTPMLIIDRQGEVHPLPFGIKSASDLQAALEPFLQADM
jgi:thiol-disulfide isomerase/thioredoxin